MMASQADGISHVSHIMLHAPISMGMREVFK